MVLRSKLVTELRAPWTVFRFSRQPNGAEHTLTLLEKEAGRHSKMEEVAVWPRDLKIRQPPKFTKPKLLRTTLRDYKQTETRKNKLQLNNSLPFGKRYSKPLASPSPPLKLTNCLIPLVLQVISQPKISIKNFTPKRKNIYKN